MSKTRILELSRFVTGHVRVTTKGFLSPGNIPIWQYSIGNRTEDHECIQTPHRRAGFRGLTMSLVTVGIMSSAGASTGSADVIASYGGGTLDLSQSWGTATVCVIAARGNQCFSSQSAYKMAASQPVQTASGLCSTGLALFENVSYGGRELILQTTSVWINLSTYSFGGITSSFQVGACGVSMTDAVNGGGNSYPGPTSAGSNVAWIGTAWNDRVASVLVL